MKALIVALAVLASTTVAHADGFVCTSESGIVLKVYNHTAPEKGTRSAALMVVSNSEVGAGNKTIAKFTDAKRTVASLKQTYVGKVDLRVSESNRKGELIGGTKLGQLDLIILSVDFSYAAPVAHGEALTATLTLQKRNGEELIEDVNCTRYLKN
jgi:hypothetical protein